jgi:hypothetical protein
MSINPSQTTRSCPATLRRETPTRATSALRDGIPSVCLFPGTGVAPHNALCSLWSAVTHQLPESGRCCWRILARTIGSPGTGSRPSTTGLSGTANPGVASPAKDCRSSWIRCFQQHRGLRSSWLRNRHGGRSWNRTGQWLLTRTATEIRGPLGHVSPLAIMWAIKRDRFECQRPNGAGILTDEALSARTLRIRTLVPVAGEPCTRIGGSGNRCFCTHCPHEYRAAPKGIRQALMPCSVSNLTKLWISRTV